MKIGRQAITALCERTLELGVQAEAITVSAETGRALRGYLIAPPLGRVIAPPHIGVRVRLLGYEPENAVYVFAIEPAWRGVVRELRWPLLFYAFLLAWVIAVI